MLLRSVWLSLLLSTIIKHTNDKKQNINRQTCSKKYSTVNIEKKGFQCLFSCISYSHSKGLISFFFGEKFSLLSCYPQGKKVKRNQWNNTASITIISYKIWQWIPGSEYNSCWELNESKGCVKEMRTWESLRKCNIFIIKQSKREEGITNSFVLQSFYLFNFVHLKNSAWPCNWIT